MFGLFLKILGALALVVMAVLAVLVLFIILRLRAMKKVLGDFVAGASVSTPSEITLAPDPDPAWHAGRKARALIDQLAPAGFRMGASYDIEQMPGVSLTALFHTRPGVFGAVYHHAQAGNWIDLVAHAENGLEITVGNPAAGSELDTRPDCRKIFMKTDSVFELRDELFRQIGDRPLAPVCEFSFPALFTTSYRRDMEWRNARGGVSDAEIRRIATNSGEDPDARSFGDVIALAKCGEMETWTQEAIDELEEITSLSLREWRAFRDSMFICGPSLDPAGFARYLSRNLPLHAEEAAELKVRAGEGQSADELLAWTEEQIACRFKIKRLGEVDFPLSATVYGYIESTTAKVEADE